MGQIGGLMNHNIYKTDWDKNKLWQGCMLASIAHAIMVSHYPEVSNEHSWDGMNYSVQDSSSSRGTISFGKEYLVGAFRDDNSQRLSKENFKNYRYYFKDCPEKIVQLAQQECLQYLLDEINGELTPVITSAIWGIESDIFSNDTLDKLIDNGGRLIEKQILEIKSACEYWRNYYDMTEKQYELLWNIYKRKIKSSNQKFFMSRNEIDQIGSVDEEGLNESRLSFSEIGIGWLTL